MTNFKIDGIENLLSKLESMGNAGKSVERKALREGAEVLVAQQKKDAPFDKDRTSGTHGRDCLDIGSIRTSKHKNRYIQVGITIPDTWKDVRGIYFQNYGYYNHKNGKYMAGSQWINKSFEKAKAKSAQVIKSHLLKELNL